MNSSKGEVSDLSSPSLFLFVSFSSEEKKVLSTKIVSDSAKYDPGSQILVKYSPSLVFLCKPPPLIKTKTSGKSIGDEGDV